MAQLEGPDPAPVALLDRLDQLPARGGDPGERLGPWRGFGGIERRDRPDAQHTIDVRAIEQPAQRVAPAAPHVELARGRRAHAAGHVALTTREVLDDVGGRPRGPRWALGGGPL